MKICNLFLFLFSIFTIRMAVLAEYLEPTLSTIEKCHNEVKQKEKCSCHKKDMFCNRSFAVNHWNSIFRCLSTAQKSAKGDAKMIK